MKINRQNAPPVIIGKRVTVGAAINSLAAVFAHVWPEHAPAIVAGAVPITFIAQVVVVNKLGVTVA
jgi:hypothetical protein